MEENYKKLLEDYIAEVFGNNDPLLHLAADGVSVHLSFLKDLIKSHRHLRNLNHEIQSAKIDAIKRGHEKGYEYGVEQALSRDYISLEKLKTMTLKELSELINESK